MTEIRKNFGSDNVGPAHPRVVEAMLEANRGAVASYGGDPWTARLDSLVSGIFQTETTVFPMATGTAANALALSALVRPFGAIVCDEVAHIMNDEAGAPEFFSGGAKLLTLPSPDGRLDPEALQAFLARRRISGVHQSPVEAISLTQATEWGTCYPTARIEALAQVARDNRLHVHMDGARFANAVSFLGATPAAVTWKAGVDVLSLGATKNGAMAAEAVVFFNRDLARDFAQRRKRAGHLWSKQRFLSAQLTGYLEGGLWLENAGRANAAAARLSQGLAAQPGAALVQPTEANEVFVLLPEAVVVRLEAAGYGFYRWSSRPEQGGIMVRLVCAFDTAAADVDALLETIRRME
nr:beta-eliminating lyase-related protein [uncultured Lichenicoccus sp.]